jgi:competence protein ComEC
VPERPGLDLRLVPSALAAWTAAAAGTRLLTPEEGAAATVGLLVCGGAALVAAGRARWHRAGPGGDPGSAVAAVALALWAAAAALGSATADGVVRAQDPLVAAAREEAVVTVEGRVASPPLARATPWAHGEADRVTTALTVAAVTVRGHRLPCRVTVDVSADASWAALVPGEVVSTTGRLRATPDRPSPAPIAAGEPRALAPAPGPQRGAARVRAGLRDATDDLPADDRGLLPGLAVGDTGRLDAGLDAAMTGAGLSHLTAVSGGHVAVLGTAVLAVAGLVRLGRTGRVVALVTVGAGFLLLAQPGPSVARAAVMGVVGITGLALGRRSASVPALAAAVVVLLVADPWWATSYGFALSVAATAAIAILGVPAAGAFPPGWRRSVLAAVTVPLAAQSACGPLLVLLDPTVSVWAVAANALVAPAVLPATVGGLVAALVSLVSPPVARAVAEAAALPTGWVAGVARACAALPGSGLPWASGPAGALASASLTAAAWLAGYGAVRVLRTRRLA